ncbi:DUF3570 domain-containing protein [Chitinophagaceae bacterium LB-8]|uniref:DUF3570 domain-containing protein n=1 Tax=Paraflavisolibacter caeni TaxID=2982496 RepID=A0A9X2XT83_9BACT|nr:DUF3570 domain-containing protein [Paraflavisolibacter caeni]MCU7548007.1 DUF3570 domain-containing protein [Paraflavisolibacter caeni]
MRKISLTLLGMYLGILSAFSQGADTANYKSRKLQLDEVNFVSSYYHQDGNNSAVTGGIGTEKLSDFANTFELKLSKYDRKARKHSYGLELGIDHYTSASSDKIDPSTITSASYSDTRIYPTLSWTLQNEKKKSSIGLAASYSQEFDYTSVGFGASYTKASKDNNREFGLKFQSYFDQWHIIYPIELRGYNEDKNENPNRNSFSLSLSLAQVINQRLQLSVIAEPVYQTGLLATKYQRVYFKDGSLNSETLPDTRVKFPIGIRANYFLGDKIILRSFYRFYADGWGVKAHTAELETPVKLTPFVSISPYYRFYSQSAADYFAPYQLHNFSDQYFTSDYDLSKFNSHFFGTGIRFAPPRGVLGIQHVNTLELRYGHYSRSTDLQANIISLQIKLK